MIVSTIVKVISLIVPFAFAVLLITIPDTSLAQEWSDTDSAEQIENKKSIDPTVIDLPLCFVMLIDDVDVPASQSGILKSVKFREGDYANLDDEVARVDDQIAQQQLADAQARKSIAEKKASDETEIKAAQLTYEHAHSEYTREKRLVTNGAGAQTKVDSWLFEARKALAMIDRAKNAKHLADLDKLREDVLVTAANKAIERHIIRSPIGGNVFEVYQPAGSWVNAGDKVLRVIRMNTLRVQGFVDAGSYDRHQVSGKKVTVTVTLARGRKVELEGTVSYVGLDEHAGNRFMVWADVENQSQNGQWILVPNDEVTMKIHLDRNAIASSSKIQNKAISSKEFKSLPAKNTQFSIQKNLVIDDQLQSDDK